MQNYTVHPHPAVIEEGRREPLFLYDPIQVTFFVANARYAIETDSLELPNNEIDIVRFTHIPSGYYVVMARNLNIIGRPDLTLPWGYARVRTGPANGPHIFWHRQMPEHLMKDITQPRAFNGGGTSYSFDAVQFSAGPSVRDNVAVFTTTVDYPSMQAVRQIQIERIEELKHEDEARHLALMGPGAF